ncbi:signal transduction histidine kinase/ligand-binding sensor domain-containing protein/DNA-binding response OmpR family regulator [Pedobacter sp. W3I1]|uniref:hybrid sensor histidine kinase/response regulator transcription factor n=1 Tax=Pedobacter sp. W3I1 TaxID=3042291 RepID=UPI002780E3B7|nr:two-component regulator propeller domain-containing protein [Pedobacter sp. W3I1]MDQ0638375.1 signal transduction histidine kinase/ligand-binding sensor domain-containing protein/DNA-binding response OmpR family regulator [Pedobacter sp. W3I1]
MFKGSAYLPFILFIYVLFCTGNAAAQQKPQQPELRFTSLTSKNGLSSNNVTVIFKDRYGLMWFGTEDGLNKFDGTNFTTYKHQANDSTSIQANEVKAIHEDRRGNLWFGTSGGSLALFNRRKNSFINYPASNTPTGFSHNLIRYITSDYLGKIWVATFAGLDVFDPDTKQVSKFPIAAAQYGKLPPTIINIMLEDSKHRMWVGTEDGLFLFNRKTSSFVRIGSAKDEPVRLAGNMVKSLAEDDNGNIWIGTTSGLSMLKSDGMGFEHYKHIPGNPNSLSNNTVQSIALSKNGQLWLGTEDGLNVFDLRTKKVTVYKPNPRNSYSLRGTSVKYVYIDKQGIYWLGLYREGINKFDSNLNLFNLIRSNVFDVYGLNAPVVTSFANKDNTNIYVATEGGGLSIFNRNTALFRRVDLGKLGLQSPVTLMSLFASSAKKLYVGTFGYGLIVLDSTLTKATSFRKTNQDFGLNSDEIFCTTQDKNGLIWIGTNGGGINVMDSNHKVIFRYKSKGHSPIDRKFPLNNYIRFIKEDRFANIWVGSHGSGVAMINADKTIIKHYNEFNSGLRGDVAQAFLEDSKGRIWVGTAGGGLNLFDQKSNKFVNFTERDGLASAVIDAIVEDDNHNLWLSTSKGISRFDPKTQKFSNYGIYNGVQNNSFIRGAVLKCKDGEIFFGGAEGMNYFNPAGFRKNKNVPSVLFTELKISNNVIEASEDGPITDHISIAKKIDLDYKQNFSLSFVSVNYTAPEQNRYSYKLEGFNKEWIDAGTAKTVSYTNLDPGEYIFHVRASNNDGVWNTTESSIKIIVHPPWWRTIYAYAFYLLAIAGTLLYIRHRGIKNLERKFALVQEKTKIEQQILQDRKEAERLHELDSLKIKFLTNLSHEFRTPLSLILGPVEKLLSQERGDAKNASLKIVKRNARRLLNLVNQILDFRKIEENELKINNTKGELVSFIADVIESFNDLSERKSIRLSFQTQFDSYPTEFDHDKLERVLFNLLSNAFKFTPSGGNITVELKKNQRDEPGEAVLITVSDTGIGISEQEQQKVFERFFQADTEVSILNQGSGIGLSIIKEFVKIQGGTIDLQSEIGKGTRFMIALPLPLQDHIEKLNLDFSSPETPFILQEESSDKAVSETDAEIHTILLVEDNQDLREYLRDNLKSNYRIVEAADGKEGWQKTLANHPELIVSDISMPNMTGIELCKKIKEDKRTKHIPVILLTALTGEQEQLTGLEIGANDYLTKPFNMDILNIKIKNLLVLNRTLKNTYTKQIKMEAAEIVVESHSDKLLKNILKYIEDNINNPQLSVEDLSRNVGMSRGSLYHKVLELTGLSPVEYIRSVKLDKAAGLLIKSDLNISQIAYLVGFATPNYFAKSFKLKFGMQPSEYLNQYRKPDHPASVEH